MDPSRRPTDTRPGRPALPRSALAANQHRDILRSDAADGFVDFLHLWAAANEAVAGVCGRVAIDAIRVVTRHRDRRAVQTANLEGLPHQAANFRATSSGFSK